MQQYIAYFSKLTTTSGFMLLAACNTPQPQLQQTAAAAPEPATISVSDRPDNAPTGTCWGNTITPAVIQTTTERILIKPADISAAGTIRAPAQYRNEDRQTILQPRQIAWHEIVCPDAMTSTFLSSLQRALTARGHHQGAVTGQLDTATINAIARYQTAQNLPGYDLTMEGAQRLGLIVSGLR